MPLPTVAIVGRPNVGKSTLFNRIVGAPRAIVDDRPGVTRDRLVARADWNGRSFLLVDTGGFEAQAERGLVGRVREQSWKAVESADVVLFVVDGRAGISPADRELARLLAETGKIVVLAVNKVDGPAQETAALEFFELGLGEPLPVSAEASRRVDELLDHVIESLAGGEEVEPPAALRIALLGRPNVGKSSILNRLVGEERVVVDEIAGTTRDAIDMRLEVDGQSHLLVDTAGIRRRSRIDAGLEVASVGRALRSLERAEVALVVVDASEGVTEQDARIASLAWRRGRAVVLVVNKWDAVPHEARDPEAFLARARELYPQLAAVPGVVVSALRKTHVEDILPAARRAGEAFRTRLSTRALNDLLAAAVAAVEPPIVKGKRARFYYASAAAASPPMVILFVNHPEHVVPAYLRYLENQIRAKFALQGTPLRLVLRARKRDERPRRKEKPSPRKARGGRR